MLRSEEEIELKHNSEVLLYAVTNMDDRQLPLATPLLIGTGKPTNR